MPWIHFYYDKNWVDDKIVDNAKKLLNHNDYRIEEYRWEKYSLINLNFQNSQVNSYKSWKYIISIDWYVKTKKFDFNKQHESLKLILDEFTRNKKDFINVITDWKFNIIILNENNWDSVIFNDRFWWNLSYYYSDKNSFIYSPEIKWILPLLDKLNIKKLNINSVYDFITSWLVFWNKTLIKWVNTVDNGNIIYFDSNNIKIKFNYYWEPIFRDTKIKMKQYIDKFDTTFQVIIKSYSKLSDNISIFLSWWYDSRTILAYFIKTKNKNKINTITFWQRYDKEYCFVKKLKNKFNFKNRRITFKEDNREFFVWLNEWWSDISNSSVLESWKQKSMHDISIDWFLWDTIIWANYFKKYYKSPKKIIKDILWLNLIDKNTDITKIFDNIDFNKVKNLIKDKKIKNEINKINKNKSHIKIPETVKKQNSIEAKIEIYKYLNRWRKLLLPSATVTRIFTEQYYPFLNYDIYDLHLNINPKLRENHNFYFKIYKEKLKEFDIWSTNNLWKISKHKIINTSKVYMRHIFQTIIYKILPYRKSYWYISWIKEMNDIRDFHLFKGYSKSSKLNLRITTIEYFNKIFILNNFYNSSISKTTEKFKV